jgi:hypothetical protein
MAQALALLGGAGLGIDQGKKEKRAAQRAAELQADAQKRAELRALTEERKNRLEQREADRRGPDMASLLTNAQRPAKQGAASTLLYRASKLGE